MVTAVNNSWPSVESNYSLEVSAVPAPQIPTAPGMNGAPATSAGPVSNGEINLKGWAVPTGSTSGYNIYMSDVSGTGYKKVNDQPITGPSHLVQGLDINKRYYFVLTSLTNDNPPVESRPSQEWSVLSQADSALPQNAPVPGAK